MGAFLLVYINAFLAFDFGQFLMGLKLVTDWVVPEISQKMGLLQVKNRTVFSPFFINFLVYLPSKSGIHWRKEALENFEKKPIKFSKTFKTRNAFFNLPNIYGVFKNPKQNFRVPNPSLYSKCLRRSLDLSRFFFATGLTNAIFFSSLKNFFNEIFWDCQIEIWDYSRQRNEKWYLWNEIRICCVCSELLCKKKPFLKL